MHRMFLAARWEDCAAEAFKAQTEQIKGSPSQRRWKGLERLRSRALVSLPAGSDQDQCGGGLERAGLLQAFLLLQPVTRHLLKPDRTIKSSTPEPQPPLPPARFREGRFLPPVTPWITLTTLQFGLHRPPGWIWMKGLSEKRLFCLHFGFISLFLEVSPVKPLFFLFLFPSRHELHFLLKSEGHFFREVFCRQ